MEFGLFGLGPRLWKSLSLCLGVACGVQNFPGGAWDAMHGWTVDTRSASASRGYLTNFTHSLWYGGLVSCSVVSVAVHRQAGVVQFLNKVVFVPIVVQRQVLGSDRGVPVPQIMEVFVEVTQLVRDVEQIVV